MAKTTISAKIDPDRLARLDRRVADLGITRTSAIESAVDAWLDPRKAHLDSIRPLVVDEGTREAPPLVLDGEPDADDPDQILLDLAAQPPSNPWGI